MVKNGNWAIWLIRTTVLSLSFDTILYTPPPLFSETGSPTLLILRSVIVPAPIFLSRPVDMPL